MFHAASCEREPWLVSSRCIPDFLTFFFPPRAVFSASVRGARIHERGAASQRQARCGIRLFVMDAFSMGEEKEQQTVLLRATQPTLGMVARVAECICIYVPTGAFKCS